MISVSDNPAILSKLKKKWKAKGDEVPKLLTVKSDSPLLAELGIKPGPKVELDPTTKLPRLFCSFCSAQVDRVNATHGKGRLSKSIRTVLFTLPNGEPSFDEVITHRVDKVVACPACILCIQPQMKKDKKTGKLELVNSNISFPETEG